MKIGIVIIHALNTMASRYALEVTDDFIKKGHEVHVFTNKHDEFDKRVIVHKIPVFLFGFRMQETSFFALATLITKFYKFDVTMAQATRFFTPDVAYQQFVYKNWAKKTKTMGISNKIVSAIEGYNLRKSKKIIVMSNQIKKEIIKYHGIPEGKIRVVYSGIDSKFFKPNKKYRKEIRQKLGLSNNEIVLVFAGNPYSRKGLNYLVKVLPLIKNAKLIVIGRDLGKDKITNYQILAEKLGVADRLIYAGFSKEINKFFAASDIFVFPTLYEPFGLVILEAMASGLPVVTSASAGAAELIGEKEGLLLKNPRSPKEIASKINYLIDNNLIKKFGKNARRKAENYTWKKTAREMERVFEEVNSLQQQ